MEGGNALADVLTGKVTPGGKPTGTWAKDYGDIPNAENYSHNNGDVQKEYYTEGIYAGYRYFDSFRKGNGISLRLRACPIQAFHTDGGGVCPEEKGGAYVTVTVKNTGDTWAGREVVQVYLSCPQDGLEKEYRRLCGFAKTKLLEPGEGEQPRIPIPSKNMASFLGRKNQPG